MENDKFSFNLLKSSNEFRRGVIKTPRGEINTPVFMPVGTQATVKGVFIAVSYTHLTLPTIYSV